MENPMISVCIPTYNRAMHIGDTLNSILKQTFGDFEIIVIDNHSDDDTEEIITSFQDNRIRFLRNDWNVGAARNANRCMMEFKGKYIKFLHSDDVFIADDALQKMYHAASKHPQAALITCGYRFGESHVLTVPFDLLRPKGFSTVRQAMNIHSFGLPSEWMIRGDALSYTGLSIDSPIGDVDLVMKLVYYFDSCAVSDLLVEHRFYGDNDTGAAAKMNGWEFMRFRALRELPFSDQLSGGMKAILSSFLHMSLMSKIKDAILNENYHLAIQGILDLLKTDPHLHEFKGEDRERVLQLLLDRLIYRKTPGEIIDYMGRQHFSKPYRDFFEYGLAFNYQIYQLADKLKLSGKKICVIGTGRLMEMFLKAFPGLKDRIDSIVEFSHLLTLDFSKNFFILASDSALCTHRYEMIRAGLIEGEHFLPILELI
ncbi:glycosyltransferase family 2 protein [Effusibacillus consociatus]|uniref:Glycosyltransferase family 2 protein n=1 Tax=Effusibacillus consociatus TaxID=1117041 RepID=A0ABV9Q0E2_9BACL